MPQSNKSPFAADEILLSLDFDCIVILEVHFQILELEVNDLTFNINICRNCVGNTINGITTNIRSEIEAMRLALEYVSNFTYYIVECPTRQATNLKKNKFEKKTVFVTSQNSGKKVPTTKGKDNLSKYIIPWQNSKKQKFQSAKGNK
ncbi:hypothetical protein RFI_28430 [Reticulomyxa filosa]|uniref:Uncharacterized protein n=1 Tax=Reticulomyxa filosa TaxID=46433 RepID=X6M671_RETFI|nr:hypothetical protein RFI_28430 [Reticulomyxa filosa]|eukprot:ETO08957.1 hypothetical protein RFI_28430 [Reticulomyxa filosa]